MRTQSDRVSGDRVNFMKKERVVSKKKGEGRKKGNSRREDR